MSLHPFPRSLAFKLLHAAAASLILCGCSRAPMAYTGSAIDAAAPARAHATSAGATAIVRSPARDVAYRPDAPLSLPIDFPDDVFVPPGYTVDSVMDRDGLHVVSLRAAGRVSRLFDDARDSMLGQGWSQSLAMRTAGDGAMLSFDKGERAVVLSFTQSRPDVVALSVQVRGEPVAQRGSAL